MHAGEAQLGISEDFLKTIQVTANQTQVSKEYFLFHYDSPIHDNLKYHQI